ncbi:hypothetical protein GGX14DRAFT_532077 [Mycena pura]|uniref:Uncharacterized protein n=1 Tax=Mycena pura TaxID=153505 RepID=A0AAD7E0R8_9AGAR|nr:hypothetical protein GGX14DRAFT_532077 [Mycena pura]
MGVHFYDESPGGPSEQRGRLGPPLALLRAGTPCVVWGEDALSIVHRVPTGLFDLQILVPDDHVSESVTALCAKLPYRVIAGGDDDDSHWRDYRSANPDRPHAFKLGPTDTDVPRRILMHRASTFYFDLNDPTKTMLNPDPPDTAFAPIRFPTVSAFLDSTVDILYEPPIPIQHTRFRMHILVLMGYVALYTLSDKGTYWVTDPETNERILLPRFLEVLESPTLIRQFLASTPGSYEFCALERQVLKAARFKRLGLSYTPPPIPSSVRTRMGRPPVEADQPKQTPYLVRNSRNKPSIQWRALAQCSAMVAKVLR